MRVDVGPTRRRRAKTNADCADGHVHGPALLGRNARAPDGRLKVGATDHVTVGRRTLVTAGAAAAAVAAALVVAVPALRPGSDEVVTQVALSPVGSATTPADAVMVAGGSGARMTVDASNLPRPVDGYYEVWLMGENNELVSLGVLDERKQGSFRVPDGVDPSRYPYVDVSLEPLDGNPAHSGDSLVRGRVSA